MLTVEGGPHAGLKLSLPPPPFSVVIGRRPHKLVPPPSLPAPILHLPLADDALVSSSHALLVSGEGGALKCYDLSLNGSQILRVGAAPPGLRLERTSLEALSHGKALLPGEALTVGTLSTVRFSAAMVMPPPAAPPPAAKGGKAAPKRKRALPAAGGGAVAGAPQAAGKAAAQKKPRGGAAAAAAANRLKAWAADPFDAPDDVVLTHFANLGPCAVGISGAAAAAAAAATNTQPDPPPVSRGAGIDTCLACAVPLPVAAAFGALRTLARIEAAGGIAVAGGGAGAGAQGAGGRFLVRPTAAGVASSLRSITAAIDALTSARDRLAFFLGGGTVGREMVDAAVGGAMCGGGVTDGGVVRSPAMQRLLGLDVMGAAAGAAEPHMVGESQLMGRAGACQMTHSPQPVAPHLLDVEKEEVKEEGVVGGGQNDDGAIVTGAGLEAALADVATDVEDAPPAHVHRAASLNTAEAAAAAASAVADAAAAWPPHVAAYVERTPTGGLAHGWHDNVTFISSLADDLDALHHGRGVMRQQLAACELSGNTLEAASLSFFMGLCDVVLAASGGLPPPPAPSPPVSGGVDMSRAPLVAAGIAPTPPLGAPTPTFGNMASPLLAEWAGGFGLRVKGRDRRSLAADVCDAFVYARDHQGEGGGEENAGEAVRGGGVVVDEDEGGEGEAPELHEHEQELHEQLSLLLRSLPRVHEAAVLQQPLSLPAIKAAAREAGVEAGDVALRTALGRLGVALRM